MEELFNNPKEEQYLSEFKQKIAQEMEANIEQRRHDLERSRNGFIGAIAGIVLAGLVSWFLLLPHFGFHQDKEVPIIRRPILPVKIQPNEPGGMEIQNQDKTVYTLVEKNDKIDTKVESLLPPPEAPQMPTIVAKETESLEASVNIVDTTLSNMDELISAVQTTATETVKIPEKLPVIDVQIQKTNDPITTKETIDVPANESTLKDSRENTNLTSQTEQNKGTWCIQMMASANKDAIQKGYEQLKNQYPLIANLPFRIESQSDGLHRLKVGAFALKDEADSICQKIKTSGGTCMVKEK